MKNKLDLNDAGATAGSAARITTVGADEMDPEEMSIRQELGDDMSGPPESDMASPNEVCVPLKSVADEGEDEQAVAPAVGDDVTMSVKGKVVRIDGEKAYIAMDEVNGVELEEVPDELEQQFGGGPGETEQGLRDSLTHSGSGGMQ